MAILVECRCHRKQSLRNKLCVCGEDLAQAKKSGRVRYWIAYHVGRKLRWERVGRSIDDARAADGKRRGEKKENRIFDIRPESKMTFRELSDWYLGLSKTRSLASFGTAQGLLKRFNQELGDVIVGKIRPTDLEDYQVKRKAAGRADKTVDDEIACIKAAVNKAFDNSLVDGDVLRVFKKIGKLLKRNSNARKRIITPQEFDQLYQQLPPHGKLVLALGFYTGMRRGEILNLTWDKVSLKERVIRLEAGDTKDKEAREIPLCDSLYVILKAIPRNLHDNHVVLYQGRPIKNISTTLQTAARKAGITYGRTKKDGFVLHDTRHSFNTNMRKAGVQESVIMEITGHSSREMFDRYNTVDAEDRRKAIQQLEKFVNKVFTREAPSKADQPSKP